MKSPLNQCGKTVAENCATRISAAKEIRVFRRFMNFWFLCNHKTASNLSERKYSEWVWLFYFHFQFNWKHNFICTNIYIGRFDRKWVNRGDWYGICGFYTWKFARFMWFIASVFIVFVRQPESCVLFFFVSLKREMTPHHQLYQK